MTNWSDRLTERELEDKLREDEELITHMAEHKRGLEDILKSRRHTHATIDGIEHALAIMVRIVCRDEMASQLRRADLHELGEVLGEVRISPTAYQEKSGSKPRLDLEEAVSKFLQEYVK